MAPTINTAHARVSKRAMGGFHWILLFIVLASTLVIALPTLTSQPVIYDARATISVEDERYSAYYADPEARQSIEDLAREATRRELEAQGITGYGTNTFGSTITSDEATGVITIEMAAPNAEHAQIGANLLADRLMRNIRAAAGRDVLQRVMNAEEYRMWRGEPIAGAWNQQVRRLIAFGAFDFPIRASATEPLLNEEDYDDLARALEVRYDQLSWILNDEGALMTPLGRRDIEVARSAISDVLAEPYPRFQSTGLEATSAYISQQAILPLEPRPTRFALELGLVVAAGLIGGLMFVFVDRAIGIVDKIRELWAFRELIRNLVVRDLKARYKSSVLGYLWSLLNPLLMILLFYFVFKTLLNSEIVNFHIFLMTALLPWNFFAGALNEGMNSIVGNENLVKKVFFPREILPLSSVIANLVNFLLSLPVLFIVILFTGGSLKFVALLLPVIVLIQTTFILGMVLFLSSLTVKFRDISHIMGVILQLWFFITPIFYALESIGSPIFAKLMRWVNPMASLIDFYRDILYGGLSPNPTPGLPALDGIARTAVTCIAVLALGSYIFHRLSSQFGEEL